MVCFFFFQAEDGIRDADVTGVQTCALPIFEGYTDGAIAAAEEHGVTVRFTPDLYRGVPVELAEECARMAVRYRERGVVGLGLGGIEGARPVSEYAKAFAIARDGGLAAVDRKSTRLNSSHV